MTGADFQMKLDAIVTDLQTVGKGQTVQVLFRNSSNGSLILPLSSSPTGVVNAAQLSSIQNYVDTLKPIAGNYETLRAPVLVALDAFNLRRATHQTAIDAASAARVALNTELTADDQYQSLAATLETVRNNPVFIQATEEYRVNNVSENYSELSNAKGKYIAGSAVSID